MDILEVISEKTTAIALALTVMYFYNKLVSDVLLERKELLEILRNERKEWLDVSHGHIETLFTIAQGNVEAMVGFRNEIHTLRNRLTEFYLKSQREKPDDSKD